MIGIVLLAAGEASRFGSPKQAACLGGLPLVRRAAIAASQVGDVVAVVIGAHRATVERLLDGLPAMRSFNPHWQEGMGGSIAVGVASLLQTQPALSALIVSLADQPLVGEQQLRDLVTKHHAEPNAIVVASYEGMLGPPCLFPVAYADELCALSGAHGARAILQRHPDRVIAIPMPQAALDIDTPADLTKLPGL